jgi:hypothetical protein
MMACIWLQGRYKIPLKQCTNVTQTQFKLRETKSDGSNLGATDIPLKNFIHKLFAQKKIMKSVKFPKAPNMHNFFLTL